MQVASDTGDQDIGGDGESKHGQHRAGEGPPGGYIALTRLEYSHQQEGQPQSGRSQGDQEVPIETLARPLVLPQPEHEQADEKEAQDSVIDEGDLLGGERERDASRHQVEPVLAAVVEVGEDGEDGDEEPEHDRDVVADVTGVVSDGGGDEEQERSGERASAAQPAAQQIGQGYYRRPH